VNKNSLGVKMSEEWKKYDDDDEGEWDEGNDEEEDW
jgi:hypothetical protein